MSFAACAPVIQSRASLVISAVLPALGIPNMIVILTFYLLSFNCYFLLNTPAGSNTALTGGAGLNKQRTYLLPVPAFSPE